MIKPLELPQTDFKTYKDKVLYILNTLYDQLGAPEDLSWCLHVIKNDLL